MAEREGREFECQAREPCEPLSPDNQQALEFFHGIRWFGPDLAWRLFDLELTPEQLEGLRVRLMQCMRLWPQG
ncbi:hypothetical protein [Nitrospira sp. Nam74]